MREIFRREIRRKKVAQNGPLYTTYVWLFPLLKDKKATTITNAF